MRRLLTALPLLAWVLVAAFVLLHLAPGGPQDVLLNARMSPAEREWLAASRGLNQPLAVQFVDWLRLVLHGNLGFSYVTQEPVAAMIADALPNTVWLLVPSFLLTVAVVLALGVYSAGRPRGGLTPLIRSWTRIGMAWPDFWVGTLLLAFFGVVWPVVPVEGTGPARLILPVFVLVFATAAPWTRFLEAQLRETMAEDYIRTALAKGLRPATVVWRHALPNAMMPMIALFGFELLPQFFAGAVIVESVFNWPGMGHLLWTSALSRDYPVLMAVVMGFAGMTIVGNLCADLALARFNPRAARR